MCYVHLFWCLDGWMMDSLVGVEGQETGVRTYLAVAQDCGVLPYPKPLSRVHWLFVQSRV